MCVCVCVCVCVQDVYRQRYDAVWSDKISSRPGIIPWWMSYMEYHGVDLLDDKLIVARDAVRITQKAGVQMSPVNCLKRSVHRAHLQTLNHVLKFQKQCVTLYCRLMVKHWHFVLFPVKHNGLENIQNSWEEFFSNICRLHPCGVGIAQWVQWLLYGLEDRDSNPGRGKIYRVSQEERT